MISAQTLVTTIAHQYLEVRRTTREAIVAREAGSAHLMQDAFIARDAATSRLERFLRAIALHELDLSHEPSGCALCVVDQAGR